MQFQVPQFIEVEDKIFGPLTFRQFVYLAGGAGCSYLLWRLLPLIIALPFIAAIVGLAVALSFFQFNGRPFISNLENAFFFFLHPRLYLWNNERKAPVVRARETKPAAMQAGDIYVPTLSQSKLHELSWSLDIKERIAGGVANEDERTGRERIDVMSPVRTAREALGR